MKKIYLTFTLLVCFFIFSFNINAISNTYGVNISDGTLSLKKVLPWNDTVVFNYFKEKSEKTDFYKMLEFIGYDIESYLGGLISKTFSSLNSDILIYTASEIDYFNAINEDKFVIPDNATHAIVMFRNYVSSYYFKNENNSIYANVNFLDTQNNGDVYIFWFNGSNFLSYEFDYNYYVMGFEPHKISTRFAALVEFPEKYKFSYNWLSSGWWIFGSETYDGSDFALLYSKFYKSSQTYNINSPYVTLYAQNLCIKNKCFNEDNIATSSGLDYLLKNPIISQKVGFKSLLNVLFYYQNENKIPSNYKTADFSLSSNVSLYPIKNCTLKDYGLYVYSNYTDEFNVYYHTISNDDKFGYLGSYYSIYKTKEFSNILINPLVKVIDSSTGDFKILNDEDFIKFSYRFWAKDNKFIRQVIYNPNCYKAQINNESIEYTNPNSGNTITIEGSNNSQWSDPENINQGNSIDFLDFNAPNLISGLKGLSSTFVEASGYIVSLSSSLLNNLPLEIQSVLIFVFIISAIVLILKIITSIL